MKCLCAITRRAARTLTHYYEEKLRPVGMTPAQFELLYNLFHQPGLAQSALAKAVGADQTTLSRNLKALAEKGWIAAAKEGRTASYELTVTGKAAWKRALPRWQRAQSEMQAALGPDWERVFETLENLAAINAAGPPTGSSSRSSNRGTSR